MTTSFGDNSSGMLGSSCGMDAATCPLAMAIGTLIYSSKFCADIPEQQAILQHIMAQLFKTQPHTPPEKQTQKLCYQHLGRRRLSLSTGCPSERGF